MVTTHIMKTYMEWLTSTNSAKREKTGINKCQKVTKAVRSTQYFSRSRETRGYHSEYGMKYTV